MIRMTLPPYNSALSLVRDAVQDWAKEQALPDWPISLIATELVANAIAVTPAGGTIEITVTCEPGYVEVTVADPGPGFGPGTYPWLPTEVPMPPPSSLRGRGLSMVRQLSAQLKVDRIAGRTFVSAHHLIG